MPLLAAGWGIGFLHFITIDYGLPFPGMSKENLSPMGIAVPWF
jgi:hypothetical protein